VPVEFFENNKFLDPYIKPSKRPVFLKSTGAKIRKRNKKLVKRMNKKERRLDYLGGVKPEE